MCVDIFDHEGLKSTREKKKEKLLATFEKFLRIQIKTYPQTSIKPQQIVHFAGTTKSVCLDLV